MMEGDDGGEMGKEEMVEMMGKMTEMVLVAAASHVVDEDEEGEDEDEGEDEQWNWNIDFVLDFRLNFQSNLNNIFFLE